MNNYVERRVEGDDKEFFQLDVRFQNIIRLATKELNCDFIVINSLIFFVLTTIVFKQFIY